GGNGGAALTGGNGGDGLGGAVFVREGGTLILENVSINSNKAMEGDGGDGFNTTGADGDAQGDGLYVMENVDVVFRVIDGTDLIVQDGIAGEGSLKKEGLGTLNLNNATFQLDAGMTVDAGRLNVNSNVESNIAISGDGELGGSGTITGNVSNLGMLAPGNSIGTLNITGDYTHNKSADIEVEIDADGNTDKLNVSGTAFLNGGTVTVVAAPGNYSGAGPYTFLEAGLVDGTFDSITDDLAFFDAELGYTGTTAFFTLIANGSDYSAEARTYNQYQTAAYLDTHSGGGTGEYRQFLDHLNFMSGNQARQAFQEASGEIYGSVGQLQVQNTTQMYLMLSQQTGGMRGFGSSGGGGYAANPASSSDMQYAYALAAPNQTGHVQRVSYEESAQPVVLVRYAEPAHNAWRSWMSGYGIGGNAQSDGNAAGGNYGVGGTTFGAEKWIDDTHAIGFWGGYANVHLSTRGLGQSATVNSVQLGGYLRYEDEDQYYLLGGAGGIDDYSTSRFIDGGGLNLMAEGNTTGGQGSAWLERGWIFRSRAREIRPFAALNYVHVAQDGFTETGAGTMNLNVGDVRTHALRGLLGGRASWTRQTSSGVAFRPELHAAWMHEFLDTETSLVTNITGAGGPGFTTRGLNYGRDWALVGGGFSLDLTHSLSFGAAYDIQANHRQALHMGSGNLQYRW
ncbi:MAG: autotransporter domain-containing protein, partial [Pirellulaceae bacterium]